MKICLILFLFPSPNFFDGHTYFWKAAGVHHFLQNHWDAKIMLSQNSKFPFGRKRILQSRFSRSPYPFRLIWLKPIRTVEPQVAYLLPEACICLSPLNSNSTLSKEPGLFVSWTVIFKASNFRTACSRLLVWYNFQYCDCFFVNLRSFDGAAGYLWCSSVCRRKNLSCTQRTIIGHTGTSIESIASNWCSTQWWCLVLLWCKNEMD